MSTFITFEGPEGSGKTTQIQLLRQALEEKVIPVICTREPGGTPIGEQIRAALHDLNNTAMLPITEVLLYSAARAQHVGEVIRPALERGDLVISDRYAESTLAYQGYGHGIDLNVLKRITQFATGGLWPDVVIYLDLDVETGLERKLHDRRDGRGEWNRMDQQDIAFHRRVRGGYLEMAREEPHRWLVIDARQNVDVIHRVIRDRIEALLERKRRTSRGS